MIDDGVIVLGIPIPSSSALFLALVAIHVAGGITCTVAGLVAMFSPKSGGRHPLAGTYYYWSLVVVSLTMTALSLLRWPHDTQLLALGIVSFAAGFVGREARRRLWRRWLPTHVTGMALSYIVLLTGFYVDNGPNLPLWRSLPPAALWLLPSVVGVPILIWVLQRHPLMEERPRSAPRAE